jgi:Tfp pilus assembly protein PilX
MTLANRYERFPCYPETHRGAVLAVALVLLLALTALALAASQTTRTNARRALAEETADRTLQSAEATLRYAESLLEQDEAPACERSRCGIYSLGSVPNPAGQSSAWWDEHGWRSSVGKGWTPLPRAPKSPAAQNLFVIEELQFLPDSLAISAIDRAGWMFYRVTTYSASPTAKPVILQSTFSKRVP